MCIIEQFNTHIHGPFSNYKLREVLRLASENHYCEVSDDAIAY